MKTGEDLGPGSFAFICSTQSPVLHTEPECPPTLQASFRRVVEPSNHPNNLLCKRCDPDHEIDTSEQGVRDTCRECAATLNTFGECDFCMKFAEVMAD